MVKGPFFEPDAGNTIVYEIMKTYVILITFIFQERKSQDTTESER